MIAVLSVFIGSPCILTAQQQAPDIPQIVARAAAAVVLIKGFDDQGAEVGIGSGFRVMGGRIATNAHVVSGSSRVEVFDKDGQLLGTSRFADALSTTVDLAILPRLGRATSILPLADALPIVGEPVVVIGAPKGLANTVTNGIVSAVRVIEGRTLIQISAPISPGSSGGPILNAKGQVIGVAVSGYRDAQNLNFAVPIADLFAVMESPVAQVPFPMDVEATSGSNAATSRPSPQPLHVGDAITGALSATDLAMDDGSLVDLFIFEGRAGQSVSFLLRSADFDGTLNFARYVGDSVDVVAYDDDSGGSTNPLVNVTLPGTGRYYLAISAHDESAKKIGTYTLSVQSGFRPVSTLRSSGEEGRWVLAGTSNSASYEFDRRSLSRQSTGIYRVWTRYQYETAQTDDSGDTYDTELRQVEFDCVRRRSRGTLPYQYLNGHVVWSPREVSWRDWTPILPSSVGEAALEKICSLGPMHSR